MVRYCTLCGVERTKEGSLHVFPTAKEVLGKGKRACGYLDTDCVKKLLICSNHFRPDEFIQYTRCYPSTSSTGIKKLKKNVVPSVNVPHNIENISPNLPQPSGSVEKIEEESFSLKRRRIEKVDSNLVEPSISAVESNQSEREYYVSTPIS